MGFSHGTWQAWAILKPGHHLGGSSIPVCPHAVPGPPHVAVARQAVTARRWLAAGCPAQARAAGDGGHHPRTSAVLAVDSRFPVTSLETPWWAAPHRLSQAEVGERPWLGSRAQCWPHVSPSRSSGVAPGSKSTPKLGWKHPIWVSTCWSRWLPRSPAWCYLYLAPRHRKAWWKS